MMGVPADPRSGDVATVEMISPDMDEPTDRAAPLDALLVDAALGPLRRLAPNSSTVRFAARLARHPVTTGRRLGGLAAELVRVGVGTSTTGRGRADLWYRPHRADGDLLWRHHRRHRPRPGRHPRLTARAADAGHAAALLPAGLLPAHRRALYGGQALVADYLKGDVGDDLEARPPN
jgi:hypothetical protein